MLLSSCLSFAPPVRHKRLAPNAQLSANECYLFGSFVLDPLRHSIIQLFPPHHRGYITFEQVETGKRFSIDFDARGGMQIFSLEPGTYEIIRFTFIYYLPNGKSHTIVSSEPAEIPPIDKTFTAKPGTAVYLGSFFADTGIINLFTWRIDLLINKMRFGHVVWSSNPDAAIPRFRTDTRNSEAVGIVEFKP